MTRVRVELDSGSRRKKWWSKEVSSVDRSQQGGYALEGNFVYAGLREFAAGAALVEYYDGNARVVLISPDAEGGLHEGDWIAWPSRALEVLDEVEEILNDPEAALAVCLASTALARADRKAKAEASALARAEAESALKLVDGGDGGPMVLAHVGIPSGILRSQAKAGKRIRIGYAGKDGARVCLRDGVCVVSGKIANGYVIAGAVIGIPCGRNVAIANGWKHEPLGAPLQRLEEARAEVLRLEAELEVARKGLVMAEAAVVEVRA